MIETDPFYLPNYPTTAFFLPDSIFPVVTIFRNHDAPLVLKGNLRLLMVSINDRVIYFNPVNINPSALINRKQT